jgi:hypothetical protein
VEPAAVPERLRDTGLPATRRHSPSNIPGSARPCPHPVFTLNYMALGLGMLVTGPGMSIFAKLVRAVAFVLHPEAKRTG